MKTMRVMAQKVPGSLDSLSLHHLPVPEPQLAQVRVRVGTSALNTADHKVLSGVFAGRFLHGRQRPIVVGYDLAGVVDAVGPGASLKVGDRVFGHLAYTTETKVGAFAEYVVISDAAVAKIPDGVSDEIAAAAASTGMTALQALRYRARVGPGMRVLVVGASGGVGSLAVGVAKRQGAVVTAICRSHSMELVSGLGADTVLEHKQEDPLSGGPYDVIFDTPAVYSYADVASLLAPGGVFVTTRPSVGFALGKAHAMISGRRCELVVGHSARGDLHLLGTWIADGMQVPIESRYGAVALGSALSAFARGQRAGKIAIDVASMAARS